MNKDQWKKWKPKLIKMKFGDNIYANSDRYKFLGLGYREGERYMVWDVEKGIISAIYLQSDKELKWYADQEEKDQIKSYKKTLPWYNLTKYL